MIIPMRCFSCGAVIAHKWEEFNEKVASGTEVSDALDQVGFSRYCCRRMYIGHFGSYPRGCTIQRTKRVI